ncbi:MAG: ribonuclease Z [Flavobacterium sp.]|nr:ribonuclease Z [Flavobacterium sp.]
MNVIKKDNLIEISDTQFDLVSFVMKITHEYKSFENLNILIDISNFENISIKDLNIFLPLIKQHSKHKKSLVLVAKEIDFNKVSDKINIVPTRQEALDLIEMENIERDLGF